ncbi:MAG: class I SAM-dependent methyltransferase [Arcobacter sp.]|nr:class I SAM-dependent methyltransferase [Arcobacter sp.]
MKRDYFDQKSKIYESDTKRVDNVKNIANAITNKIELQKNDTILDFGSGTGLLTEHMSKHVKRIIANDISESMNKKIEEKIKDKKFFCDVNIMPENIDKISKEESIDAIVSSMTIHHIEDVQALMQTFFNILKKGGKIALADLELEDGTFHKEDTGVFHFGFDQEEFINLATKAGFIDLEIKTVSIAQKPYGTYPIFLLTGSKPQ